MKLFDVLRGGSEEDRFARLVIDRLVRAGHPRPSYDPAKFQLTFEDGRDIWLANALSAWKRARGGAEKEREIGVLLATLAEGDEDGPFESVSDRLLPLVRSRALLAAWALESAGTAQVFEGAMAPFCGTMAAMVGIDRPSSMMHVESSHLAAWSRSFDEVMQIAIENLRARSPCSFERMPGGFFVSDFRDYWDSGRILLPHLFGQLDLRGDPVAVVASRECVVVTGSEDRKSLAAMAEYVEAGLPQADRPVSWLPIVLREGAWRPMDTSGEGMEPLDSLRVREQFWNCQVQQELLQDHIQAQGRDAFVALVTAVEDGDRVRTFSGSGDVETLFAEVDAVGIKLADGREFVVSWSDFVAVCGPFEQEPGAYPPRFMMRGGTAVQQAGKLGRCDKVPWFHSEAQR